MGGGRKNTGKGVGGKVSSKKLKHYIFKKTTMRTKTLLIAVLFFSIVKNGQSQVALDYTTLGKFGNLFESSLQTYVCNETKSGSKIAKIVSWGAFDTLFVPVFGKVIFGNNDLVKQGSAGTFSLNQFESKFGISYSFAHDKKNPTGYYHTFGFNAVNSSKSFQLYSKKEWQRGYSINYTGTIPLDKGVFFDVEDCKELEKKRKLARVYWLKDIKNLLLTDVTKINTDISAIEALNLSKPAITGQEVETEIDKTAIKDFETLKKLQKTKSDYEYLKTVITAGDPEIKKYADSIVTKFDKENFVLYKYHFWWFNYTIKPEYKGINIYDTAAASIVGIERKDFFRMNLDFSLNYFRNAKNLTFAQFGLGVKNTNFLEGKKPDDLKSVIVPVTPSTEIVSNEEAVIVSDYSDLKKGFVLLSPYAGANFFFGKKRILGLEFFGSAKFGLEPKDVEFGDLYTFRSGLLFSMNGKSDMGKTTFGIIAQWEDVPFKGEKDGNYFTLSVRFGIPFNN